MLTIKCYDDALRNLSFISKQWKMFSISWTWEWQVKIRFFAHFTLAVVRIQCRRARAETETSKETMVEGRYGGLNWTVRSMNVRNITESSTDKTRRMTGIGPKTEPFWLLRVPARCSHPHTVFTLLLTAPHTARYSHLVYPQLDFPTRFPQGKNGIGQR